MENRIEANGKIDYNRSISAVLNRIPETEVVSDNGDDEHYIAPPHRELRWFESGSVESVHLSSSVGIFAERPAGTNGHPDKKYILPAGAQAILEQEKNMWSKSTQTNQENKYMAVKPILAKLATAENFK